METAIRPLTAAIAAGGSLQSLVGALQPQEDRRRALRGRLDILRAPDEIEDRATIRRRLQGYLRDWQGLLKGHVHQAQQVLRRLVVGRLTFTPTDDGCYKFSGIGTVQPLLAGIVRKLASPKGSADLFCLVGSALRAA